MIAEQQFSLSVGEKEKASFLCPCQERFKSCRFFAFSTLSKAFAFFIVVQVKQKEKNFDFVIKGTEQTIKADKQLKKLFLFSVRFKSNKKERFFCIVDAFFLTDGNVFVF